MVGEEGERSGEKEASGNMTCLNSWRRRNRDSWKMKLKLKPGDYNLRTSKNKFNYSLSGFISGAFVPVGTDYPSPL